MRTCPKVRKTLCFRLLSAFFAGFVLNRNPKHPKRKPPRRGGNFHKPTIRAKTAARSDH